MVAETEFLKMLLISVLVGGLLGVERELKVNPVAGMRTFMLTSVFGTFTVFIARALGEGLFLVMGFLGIILVTILMGAVKNYKLEDVGVTTCIAFLLAYLLGVMVGLGYSPQAVAASILITMVLVSKKYLRAFSETLSHDELINALEFGLIVFVLYPVVPNAPIDPLHLINPRVLLLIIIIVTSIGFAGFLALRKMGMETGLPVVGALGGLVNSSAATSALAIRVRERVELLTSALLGIVLSNVVMLARNLVIVASISAATFQLMLVPQMAMVGVGLLYSYLFLRPEKRLLENHIPLESPFAILPSIKFALIFTAFSVALDQLKAFGVGSVYLASVLGGLISSAAVTGSIASLAALGSLDIRTAANACIISAIGSGLGKVLIGRISGTSELRIRLLPPMAATVVVGVAALFLQGGL